MSKNNKKDNNTKRIKIILLGEVGTGKTNLINAFFNKPFNPNPNTTFSSEYSKKEIKIDGNKYIIDIWDTAGQEKFSSMTKIFIKGAHIVILVYDITSKKSFQQLKFWVNILDEILWEYPIIGLVGNKIDLFSEQIVPKENGIKYAKEINAIFCETSAKEDKHGFQDYVKDLVKTVVINNKNIDIFEEKISLKYTKKKSSKC